MDDSTYENELMWYATLTKQNVKPHVHLNKCRKSIWQNSVFFHDKSSQQTWNIPQQKKGICENPHFDILVNGKKLKTFPLVLGTRQRCPFFLFLFNILLEALVSAVRKRESKKDSR